MFYIVLSIMIALAMLAGGFVLFLSTMSEQSPHEVIRGLWHDSKAEEDE